MAKVNVGSGIGGGTIVLDTSTGKTSVVAMTPTQRGSGGRGVQFTPTDGGASARAAAAQAAKEQAAKEQAAREQAAKEQVARETAAREQQQALNKRSIEENKRRIVEQQKVARVLETQRRKTQAPRRRDEVQIAPTEFEKIKANIRRKGIIGGSVESFTGGIQRLEDLRQQRTKDFSRGAELSRAAKFGAEVGLFFVAPEIFLARGIEAVGTEKGRERLSQQKAQLESGGLSPLKATLLTSIEPATDVIAGGVGTVGRQVKLVSGFRAKREAQLLKDAPVVTGGVRVTEPGGVISKDVLGLRLRTQPNFLDRNLLRIKPTEVTTVITQPSFKVGGVTIAKDGKGFTKIQRGKEIEIQAIETSGVFQDIKSTPLRSKVETRTQRAVSTELEGFGGGIGDVKVKKVGEVTGKISGGTFKGQGKVGDLGTIESPLQLSLAKRIEEGKFVTIAGRPVELSINTLTGEKFLRFKPQSIGGFKTVQKPDISSITSFQGRGLNSKPTSSIGSQQTLSPESQIILQKTQQFIKPKPPVTPPKVVAPATQTQTQQQFQTPSIFQGSGQFEQTTEQPTFIQSPQLKSLQESKVIERQRSGQGSRLKTVQASIVEQRSDVSQITTPQVKQRSAQDTKTPTVQRSQQLQRLRQAQTLNFKTSTTSKPRSFLIPRIIVPPTSNFLQTLSKAVGTEKFRVFVRKKGQDIEIGTKRSQSAAVTLLTKRLKGTLSASGFIEKESQRLKFTDLKIKSAEFRPSLLNPFTVVQKKTKRLGTGGETSSLQFFRKQKKGKTSSLLRL